MAILTRLFKKPDELNQVMNDLKNKGYEVEVLERGADPKIALVDAGLFKETLDYYELGLVIGGKILKVEADEGKADEARAILQQAGAKVGVEKMDMWSSSPGFNNEDRMSATNPVDAPMTGDFRKY